MRLYKSFAVNSVLSIMQAANGLIVIYMLSKYLEKNEISNYVYLTAVSSAISPLLHWNINGFIHLYYKKTSNKEKLLQNTMLYANPLALIFGLVLTVIYFVVTNQDTTFLAAIGLVAMQYFNIANIAFEQVSERYEKILLLGIYQYIFIGFLAIYFAVNMNGILYYYIASMILSVPLLVIYFKRCIQMLGVKKIYSSVHLKKVFYYGVSVFIYSFANSYYGSLDRLSLKNEDANLIVSYGLVLSICSGMQLINSPVSTTWGIYLFNSKGNIFGSEVRTKITKLILVGFAVYVLLCYPLMWIMPHIFDGRSIDSRYVYAGLLLYWVAYMKNLFNAFLHYYQLKIEIILIPVFGILSFKSINAIYGENFNYFHPVISAYLISSLATLVLLVAIVGYVARKKNKYHDLFL